MKLFSKKDIGFLGEDAAARHLKKQGYKLLNRNCQCGKNELDLVMRDGRYIVFVEVKSLTFECSEDSLKRRPSMAVNMAKRRRTVEAMRYYLQKHPTNLIPRLDVIEIYLNRSTNKPFKVNHIPDAFGADGSLH